MKPALVSLAAMAALAAAVATPAAAQPYRHGAPWVSVNARQARIDTQIDRGLRTGQLTRREASRLKGQFRAIQRLEARYRAGGLSAWERNDLDRRLNRLEVRTRYERTDRQHRRW
jgi:hypothetical protein